MAELRDSGITREMLEPYARQLLGTDTSVASQNMRALLPLILRHVYESNRWDVPREVGRAVEKDCLSVAVTRR